MRVLVDASAALRVLDVDDPNHAAVSATLNTLLKGEAELGITPQVLREMWNVLTRPRSANGFGMEPSEADVQLADVSSYAELWDDVPGISARWRQLVSELNVRGVQVHDANLAAAALTHGATKILTLNGKDFNRFRPYGLEPIGPDEN